MFKTYGFRYTSQEDANLFKLVSIGHETTSDTSYRWNGLTRGGRGVIFQYTMKGAGKLHTGKETYIVPAGHAFLVNIPGDHEYAFDPDLAEEWEYVWIRFDGIVEDWLNKNGLGLQSPIVEISPDSAPFRLLWQLYTDTSDKHVGDRFDLSLRIYEWLLSLQRSLLSRGAYVSSEIPSAYTRVAAYIDRHYAEDLTLEQLAEIAGLNKYYLCKMFPHYLSATPMDYVRNRRIEKAAEMLRNGQLPITTIATLCGFSNVSYFGKVFHKLVGLSPSAFREAEEGHAVDVLRLLD